MSAEPRSYHCHRYVCSAWCPCWNLFGSTPVMHSEVQHDSSCMHALALHTLSQTAVNKYLADRYAQADRSFRCAASCVLAARLTLEQCTLHKRKQIVIRGQPCARASSADLTGNYYGLSLSQLALHGQCAILSCPHGLRVFLNPGRLCAQRCQSSHVLLKLTGSLWRAGWRGAVDGILFRSPHYVCGLRTDVR